MPPKETVILELTKAQAEDYSNALSDFLCWIEGFKSGGGTYHPSSENSLRDLNINIKQQNKSKSLASQSH